MTITVANREPDTGAVDVSPFARPRFSVVTDDPLLPVNPNSVMAWVNGRLVVNAGVVAPGSKFENNGLGGFNIVADAGRLPEQQLVTARVVADQVGGGGAVDISWTFTIADNRGPVLSSATPVPGSLTTTSPASLFMTLSDPGSGNVAVTTLADFVAEPANLAYVPDVDQQAFVGPGTPANQIRLPKVSFVADATVNGDELSSGTYTFSDDDVGKYVRVRNDTRRVTEYVGPHVIVDRDFTFAASGEDWELFNHSLEGLEGRLFEVNSGDVGDIGQRRRIVSVQGPEVATYDGAQLTSTAANITMFSDKGLDVVVDGVRVIHSGFPDPDAALAGWVGIVTVIPPNVQVEITSPVTWDDGTRVPVHILAPDEIGKVSDINYVFDVGDVRGPQVVNVIPDEGARGLDTSPTPNSDIQFDLTTSKGVDTATLNVEINGVPAILNGAPQGDWSGSTVTDLGGGVSYRVVLKRSNSYTDGEIVFVDITCDDDDGRSGERRVIRFHFGTTGGDSVVNTSLGGSDIVRVIAYDLGATSFARPMELNHSGYAWDGFLYTNGNRGTEVASWFTELGHFPLSGHVVVTGDNGWAIVKSQDSGAWMTCSPETSPAWSMADNDTLTDADFGPDAVLAISGANVLLIDFTADKAFRYNAAGRAPSAGDITSRDSDQSGQAADTSFAIPLGPHQIMSMHRDQDNLILALGTGDQLTIVNDLDPDLVTRLSTREGTITNTAPVVTRTITGATFVRSRLGTLNDIDNITPLVIAYNNSGQGQVEVWDWFKFLLPAAAPLLFLDDVSTPALAAAEVRDLDVSQTPGRVAIAAVMVGELDVLDYDIDGVSATIQAFSETDLGLNGVASAELSAVALEHGFVTDNGHLYAAVAAPADGRVTRFRVHSPLSPDRVVVMHSGQPFTTLSVIGAWHLTQWFVNVSMDVA